MIAFQNPSQTDMLGGPTVAGRRSCSTVAPSQRVVARPRVRPAGVLRERERCAVR